jgi:hypothetical protein
MVTASPGRREPKAVWAAVDRRVSASCRHAAHGMLTKQNVLPEPPQRATTTAEKTPSMTSAMFATSAETSSLAASAHGTRHR